jgi:hypothetical protein
MPRINSDIANLINGVSQQPATLRLPTQLEAQNNMFSSLVRGLERRPPSQYVAKLNSTVYSDVFIHTINRDANEQYVVLVPARTTVVSAQTDISYDTTDDSINSVAGTPFEDLVAGDLIVVSGSTSNDGTYTVSSLKSAGAGVIVDENLTTEVAGDTTNIYLVSLLVYDLDGVAQTVNHTDGMAFFAQSAAPSSNLQMVTIADFTFMVDKSVTVAMDSTSGTTLAPEALIYVKEGLLDTTYSITIDGTERANFDPLTVTANAKTDNIATELFNDLEASIGSGGDSSFTFTLNGNVIHCVRANSAEFTIRSKDSSGDNALLAIKDTIQNFGDLPPKGVDGFTVKVTGDDINEFDNFYVKYEEVNNSGVWVETVAPNITVAFDATTMPHQLVRNVSNQFDFNLVTWDDRTTGDETTAADPTFVTRTINDIFFYKNRLGVLSDENLILSETSSFFNFWPTTVTAFPDSDRIDIAAPSRQVNLLRFAIEFDESLVTFSDNAQFVLEPRSGDAALTPKTAELTPTTKFESSAVEPAAAGQNIYFVADKGEFTTVREYMVSPDTLTNDANEITSHVPSYIPKNVTRIASNPNEDMVFLLTSEEVNVVYVYKFFFNGAEKIQSSWSKWTFDSGDTIHNIDVVDGQLFLVVGRTDGTFLEKIDLSPGVVDDTGILYYLDRKILTLTGVYDSGNDVTNWTLPWSDADDEYKVVYGTAWGNSAGKTLAVTRPSATVIRSAGDHSAFAVIIGKKYTSSWTFSELVVREDGGSGAAIQAGKVNVQRMIIGFSETGFFEVQVTPNKRSVKSKTFDGKTIGDYLIGSNALKEGEFEFTVMSDSKKLDITITTDSHLPCAFTNAEWIGFFKTHSRRI